MTKTIYLTVAVTGLLCAAAFVAQSSRLDSLQREIDEKRVRIGVSDINRELPSGDISSADETETITESPEERILRVRSEVEQIAISAGNVRRNPVAMFNSMAEMLESIRDLTVDELFTVIEGIDATTSISNSGGKSLARVILAFFATEHDPVRAYRNPELGNDDEIRGSLLGALIKRDPDATLQMHQAGEIELSRDEQPWFFEMLAIKLFERNVAKGIELLRDNASILGPEPRDVQLGTGAIAVPEQAITGILSAARLPENAEIKDYLIGMVLSSSMVKRGVAEARGHAERAKLSVTEQERYFLKTDFHGTNTEPAAYLEWITDVASPEIQKETIPKGILRWAAQDHDAAGKWLGKMESSPARDDAIQRFAQSIHRLDPRASIIWAGEIQDPNLRRHQVSGFARGWLKREPEAAAAWIQEQGIDASPTHGSK